MDYDRKSTTSSFYGRKNSTDALNVEYTKHQPSGSRDDASSFYNPESKLPPGAAAGGYSRASYFDAGRQEPLKGGRDEEAQYSPEDPWDVYADFNNAGPRYSKSPFGSDGYQALGTPSKVEDDGSHPVEMVTVPALGPEWGKSEMRDLTKAGKAERRAEARKKYWTEFKQGKRGRWCNKRVAVFVFFGVCVIVGILLAFLIPRVPGVSFNADKPLVAATGDFANSVTTAFSRAPANFTFPANVDLQLNTQGSYIPVTFNHLYGWIYDVETGREVASGDLGHYTVPAKAYPHILFPVTFSYVAPNTSDTTWMNWYDACKNTKAQSTTDGSRPTVKFRIELEMHIRGLVSSSRASTQISDAACPIELALNAG